MQKIIILALGLLGSSTAMAEGINCENLPEWSDSIDGYQVNQQHIFCGQPGNRGNAKGFHAMPNGAPPSSYISSTPVGQPNSAGVYQLKDINLKFNRHPYVKSFSSVYPKHCTQAQINKSIVYSYVNRTGSCAAPNWASCGPNAPTDAKQNGEYCVGNDGSIFEIATAVLPNEQTKLNTGFPIFKP